MFNLPADILISLFIIQSQLDFEVASSDRQDRQDIVVNAVYAGTFHSRINSSFTGTVDQEQGAR